MTTLIEGAIGWAVGRIADTAGSRLKERLQEKGAKKELAEIIERTVESAVEIAPSLAEDFRSEIFLNHVLVPTVLEFLLDPTSGLNEMEIAERYIEKFVVPFLRGRSTDETLAKIFLSDRETLRRAFAEFLKQLRPELYKSHHWPERMRDVAVEETRSAVLRIERKLTPSSLTSVVDIDVARSDARVGSEALKSWPKTIGNQYIERPELEQLIQRIRDSPFGSTLVIGEAGSGKSALFAELVLRLQAQGMVVFAIKADLLPTSVRTFADVSSALDLQGHMLAEIDALARIGPVVVLIDQLDAVSEVMDRSSERMRLLLQLANHFREKKRVEKLAPPVHVLVSSRKFEAEYDARFQSLEAETVNLTLPSFEQVENLLGKLDIAPEDVPSALRETLRRPFALRLFVDIVRRGFSVRELIASELLNTWLASAALGDSTPRREALTFLERLAVDMTQSESLWRPADRYEMENPHAVMATVACGLVVRQGGLLGFSHQAWLDDFQAKGFSTGQALAEYAWQRQDGLFARATVLRALQRLRALDPVAYVSAIDALLGVGTTRRHLRHLVVDLIAGQQDPHLRERGWVQKTIRGTDVALARRALARVTSHWSDWRDHLRSLVVHVMNDEKLRGYATQLLVAEAGFDAAFVSDSIARLWPNEDRDHEALQVFWRAAQWSPKVADRLDVVFQRQELDNYVVVNYMEALADERAVELLQLYLNRLDFKKDDRLAFHGLRKLTERSALSFTRIFLPWFVRIATLETDGSPGLRNDHPRSRTLPHSWSEEHFEDGLFGTIRSTVIACAQTHPLEFWELCQAWLSTEVDEVQTLIAEALAEAGAALSEASVEFLLADERRLHLGMTFLNDTDNVGHLVIGWSSQLLLDAIATEATTEQLEEIRKRIENWEPHKDEAWQEGDARTRLRRRRWEDEARFPLLDKLPAHLLTPRRRRQIQEWRKDQPVFKRRRGIEMASFVKSPMSVQQMNKASDEDLFRMLDEISDGTDRRQNSRRSFRDGGTVELGRAFAAFGKENPDRALLIAERFQARRHEYAAGELVRALAEGKSTGAQQILRLIHKWNEQGFVSEGWRRDAAWAMQAIAEHFNGLSEGDIKLLESWVIDDAQIASERIKRRIELDEHNRQLNKGREPREVHALVFHRVPGGMQILPQDNFTLLSAIAAGLLNRDSSDWNSWLSVLERHVLRSEDPVIWTALLSFRGQALYWADRGRAGRLLDQIWQRFPEAFSDWYIAGYLWTYRAMVPGPVQQSIRDAWLSSENSQSRQTGGEWLMAAFLVDPEDSRVTLQVETILAGPESPERLGALFTASGVWQEDDLLLREKAHQVLMRFAGQASGSEAIAIASSIDNRGAFIPDELTQQLLEIAGANPEVLGLCLHRSFSETLQELLLSPGFEALVLQLSHRCADLMFAKDEQTVRLPLGENFVAIAVALQRSPEPIRMRAMDLYERLLDGAAYGAEEAAEASLLRSA